MQNKTKRLTESAMLLAMAIVLELVSKMFIPEQPFGGQLTIVSMLPIVLISYRHGVKWGFVAAFAYALIEMVMGASTISARRMFRWIRSSRLSFTKIFRPVMVRICL